MALPERLTGHERDLHSAGGAGDDLDYMHARFCSPVTGRFLSVDPHGVVDLQGESEEDRAALRRVLAQPQSWNRYAYVKGNPLRYVDPDGEEAVSVTTTLVFAGEAAGGGLAAAAGPFVLAGGVGALVGTGINKMPGVAEGIQSGLAHVSSGEAFRTRTADTNVKISSQLRVAEVHLGKIASAGGPDKDPAHGHHQSEIRTALQKAKNLAERLPKRQREQALQKIDKLAERAGITLDYPLRMKLKPPVA